MLYAFSNLSPQCMLEILSASKADYFLSESVHPRNLTHVGRYLGNSPLPDMNVALLMRKAIETQTTQRRSFSTRRIRTEKSLGGSGTSIESKLQEVLGDRNSLAGWLKKAKVFILPLDGFQSVIPRLEYYIVEMRLNELSFVWKIPLLVGLTGF